MPTVKGCNLPDDLLYDVENQIWFKEIGDGTVRIGGALWRARTNRATPIAAGGRIRVVEIVGLLLEVEPEEGAARDHRERRSSSPAR